MPAAAPATSAAAARRSSSSTPPPARPGSRFQPRSVDLLALDQALERLAALDAAQARLVELRFFGGLSVEEAAEALGVSTATAGRDFRSARAFLARELGAA